MQGTPLSQAARTFEGGWLDLKLSLFIDMVTRSPGLLLTG